MKTSARNQFMGKVARVTRGAVNDEIVLELASGQNIVATITHESADRLGLQPGVQAFAMINAPSVIVVVDDDSAKFSTRNRMAGLVSRVLPGGVNTEVVIELDGGGTLAAVITNESCANLDLAVGARSAGIFKASSVVLGVLA